MSFPRRSAFLRILALLAGVALPAEAQVPADSLPPGARIRIRAPEAGIPWRTTGVLDSLARDTVFVHGLRDPVELRQRPVFVPATTIEVLDVSAGRRSRWARAGRGALWGLGVYAVMAGTYIVYEKSTCTSGCFGGGFAWIGLAGAAPWAAGIGAGVGFALPVESWRRVQLRGQVR